MCDGKALRVMMLFVLGTVFAFPVHAIEQPEKETRLSPFKAGASENRLSPYVTTNGAKSSLLRSRSTLNRPARQTTVGNTNTQKTRTGIRTGSNGRPNNVQGSLAPRPTRAAGTVTTAATPFLSPSVDPIRISTPQSEDTEVAFSRPTMVKDNAPRQLRVGSGWIAGRAGRPPQPQPRPDAPSNAAATVGTGGQATVTWQDRSTNETHFVIEHQIRVNSNWEDDGSFTVGAGREQLQVTLATGTHRFRVIAVNSGGNSQPSAWSSSVTVEEPVEPDPLPAAPTNLTIEATGHTTVTLHWDDNSVNETSFEIERDPNFSGGNRSVNANVLFLNDTITIGTFRYRVRAVNGAGSSAFTPWVTHVVTEQIPAAPTSPAVADVGNQRDLRVTWVDASNNEEGFVIQRQTQVGSQWDNQIELTAAANATSLVNAPGAGTFRFRVAARNSQGTSPFTNWVTGSVVVASGGWTDIAPSSDSRVVYVSSSAGNDSNNGLSENAPKRSIAAAYAVMRNGYPDHMLLRRGDTWTESFGTWTKSGRSLTEPMVVRTYGDAVARPLIRSGNRNGLVTAYGPNENYKLHDLAFIGFELHAHTYTGSGSCAGFQTFMPIDNLLLEDIKITGYGTNLAIQGRDNSAGSGVRNLKVRRCVFVDAHCSDAHSQGAFVSGVYGGLFEENVFDKNGFKPGVAEATIFNHNMYITNGTTDIVLRRNIISDGSSHGIQLRSGGEIRENLIYKNAIGVLLGGGDTVDVGGVEGQMIDNVILAGKDITPSIRRGYGIDLKNIRSATIRGNIVANKLTNTGAYAMGGYVSGGPTGVGVNNVHMSQNYIVNWGGSFSINSLSAPATYSGNVFEDNTIIDVQTNHGLVSTPNIGPSNVQFRNNKFWSQNNSSPFTFSGASYNLANWRQRTSDTGSTFSQMQVGSGLTLGRYAAQAGIGSTDESFIEACRARSRYNWNEATDPRRVLEYLRGELD